jgi:hypothetical protein
MFSVFRRFRLRGGPLAVGAFLLLSVGVAGGAAVRAHETDCPRCKLPVVQDTATRDNEVALRYGRKRIEYRCVACALAEARTEYKNDLTILAPSEIKTSRSSSRARTARGPRCRRTPCSSGTRCRTATATSAFVPSPRGRRSTPT